MKYVFNSKLRLAPVSKAFFAQRNLVVMVLCGIVGLLAGCDRADADVVCSMQPGQVSDPVATPFGFHLTNLNERPVTGSRPIISAESEIRTTLRDQLIAKETRRLEALVRAPVKDREGK